MDPKFKIDVTPDNAYEAIRTLKKPKQIGLATSDKWMKDIEKLSCSSSNQEGVANVDKESVCRFHNILGSCTRRKRNIETETVNSWNVMPTVQKLTTEMKSSKARRTVHGEEIKEKCNLSKEKKDNAMQGETSQRRVGRSASPPKEQPKPAKRKLEKKKRRDKKSQLINASSRTHLEGFHVPGRKHSKPNNDIIRKKAMHKPVNIRKLGASCQKEKSKILTNVTVGNGTPKLVALRTETFTDGAKPKLMSATSNQKEIGGVKSSVAGTIELENKTRIKKVASVLKDLKRTTEEEEEKKKDKDAEAYVNDLSSEQTCNPPNNALSSEQACNPPNNALSSEQTCNPLNNALSSEQTCNPPNNALSSEQTCNPPNNALSSEQTCNPPNNALSSNYTSIPASRHARESPKSTQGGRNIFCIYDNHWYIARPVREELLLRGWFEINPERRLLPKKRQPPVGPVATVNTKDMSPPITLRKIETLLDHEEDAIGDMKHKISPKHSHLMNMLTLKEVTTNDMKHTMAPTHSHTMNRRGNPKVQTEQKNPPNISPKKANLEFRIKPPEMTPKKSNLEIRQFAINYNNKKLVQQKQQIRKTGTSDSGVDNSDLNNMTTPTSTELDTKYTASKTRTPKSAGTQMGRSDNEKLMKRVSEMMRHRINLMWLSVKPGTHLKSFNYVPDFLNKFQKTSFCTKVGLWRHLSKVQWFAHEVEFPVKYPRMYNTGDPDDLTVFRHDFNLTACTSLLTWLTETVTSNGLSVVQSKQGKVPLRAFEFAVRHCERYIQQMQHNEFHDLQGNFTENPSLQQEEWDTFFLRFYAISNEGGKFNEEAHTHLALIYTKASEVLRSMRKYRPEMDVDGMLNLWIIKPYQASCGRGIFITNNIYYISKHSKYIIQKYIEKPFLIHNTKFDIRQWFMVTRAVPLEIWMYKECYLRFCTQPFELRNLHESVHLSNNSVQKKYLSHNDPSMPDQNMWDSETFQQFLKEQGEPTVWKDVIYPGMRDAIVTVLLAAQDTLDAQDKQWFEVYGADFMLSQQLKDGPWLIEINENPAMDPSTKVTARLCPQMLRDVIKVVVDRKSNRNADTGQWELIYSQNYTAGISAPALEAWGRKLRRSGSSKQTKVEAVDLISG